MKYHKRLLDVELAPVTGTYGLAAPTWGYYTSGAHRLGLEELWVGRLGLGKLGADNP